MTREDKLNLISDLSNNFDKPPLIIELSGTPNSGKTSLIEEIDGAFRRYNIRCKVICESAKYCKISNKKTPQYNYWTALETIQRIISVIDQGYKIILCDRGIFDAITWMKFYYNSKLIRKDDFESTIKFYSLNIWRQFIHYVILITCSPQIAIERDATYKEFKKYGSIVNLETLQNINIAISEAKEEYSHIFNNVFSYDTSNNIESVKRKITDKLFDYLLFYMQ